MQKLKYTLEKVQQLLPSYVSIYPETFVHASKPAKFKDLEFGDDFQACPLNVIYRGAVSKARRKDIFLKTGKRQVTLEDVKRDLPEYLSIIEESWVGYTKPAKFYDKEYDEYFVQKPYNIIKLKVIGGTKRREAKRHNLNLSEDEINKRLDSIYGEGFAYVIYSTYKNVDSVAEFFIASKNTTVSCCPGHAFLGFLSKDRYKNKLFRKQVLEDYQHRCFITEREGPLDVHHIYNKSEYKEYAYDKNNGVPLSKEIHKLFHKQYGKKTNATDFLTFCQILGISDEQKEFILNRLSKIPNTQGSAILWQIVPGISSIQTSTL